METTVRWAMASALNTQAPMMTLVHVAWRAGSACTKWLGHPLVHVLLRIKTHRNPRWHATKVPAEFGLEDDEACKARNKAITAGALVLMIANSQGAEKFLCPTRTFCLEWELRQMGCVEYQDPHAHDFPLGGMSARQYARFTPRFQLPKAFLDNNSSTHDPVLTDAAAIHGAPDNHVFEDISVEFPGRPSP